MSNLMTVRLGDPGLIFMHSVALPLIGVAIGMHWHQSGSTAIWIAVSGAMLIVINEMISGFFWSTLTALWIHTNKRAVGARGRRRNQTPECADYGTFRAGAHGCLCPNPWMIDSSVLIVELSRSSISRDRC